MAKSDNAGYNRIIEHIFHNHYTPGVRSFEFTRPEILEARDAVAPHLTSINPGDVKYHFNNRGSFPATILATQPPGEEWGIFGAGRARYEFKLVSAAKIRPNESLIPIAIPDATPEIIRAYAMNDEQALLAVVRYNRLIDVFLGVVASSLQNHLRTTVKGIGQIEIDELYVGVDKHGCHHIIPVQAKGGKDETGIVQISQDIAFAAAKFPRLRCKAVAAQFMENDVIAMFHLAIHEGAVRIVEERHYRLVNRDGLDERMITDYRD